MVKKSHAKRKRDIKTKLMAAICMLLVSSIMMVSTTYAWFTLSTAPEVTGINTAVGANGNLEMALMPNGGNANGITSAVGDSAIADIAAKNITWGNLVDLSDSTVYGLDKITLYPAALNLTDTGKIDVNGYILETPTYGADGRVDALTPNAMTGYFNDGSFYPTTDAKEMGVRALGTTSGMTPRQLSYRNALSAASTAASQAANKASAALNANGSALANIAIEYGMGANTAEFDATDVAALRSLIDALKGTDGALKQIEKSYMQYILAFAASSLNTAENSDEIWAAVEILVNSSTATLAEAVAEIGEENIPEAVMSGINNYTSAAAQVTAAETALAALEADVKNNADAKFNWTQISAAMTPLANPASIKVNGIPAGEVREKLGDLVSSITAQGGLKVILETGAGVFADIADQSADYTASVTIEKVEYNQIVLNNMTARMEAKSTLQSGRYLTLVGAALSGNMPEGTSATAQPITDMYGYIIDLAFRTNATDSKLLLQKEAADRIYSDNTNEETMGHGSSMTFMATTTDFDNDDVKGLMNAIKIVFFDPADGTIYCYGALDTEKATVGMDGVTAQMYLLKADADGKATTTKIEDDAIMALTQNVGQALSVLVYLDGYVVTNANVAATGSETMTGTMNLQFASSANLVPMEYADLHIPGNNGDAETPVTPEGGTEVTPDGN